MHNIKDLHFEKEIFPLFNFCKNDYSKEALVQLLANIPADVQQVLWRQQVLKAFIQHEPLLTAFAYDRFLFNDVYDYLKQIKSTPLNQEKSWLKKRFFFSRKNLHRERGRLAQLYIFLYRVQRSYFTGLNIELFPASFTEAIKNINEVLAGLEVVKWYPVLRTRSFHTAELIRITRKLAEMSRNGVWDAFWGYFFLFEAYLSIARGIHRNKLVFPAFIEYGLSVKGFYHPLLKDPVKNDLATHAPVNLITGPNMSGKSTLLKAIGLCVYLAHLGLAVPAEKCDLMFFNSIVVAINLNDDLRSGFSHFMTEIKSVKSVVLEARQSKRCFAIFDELFRGTNHDDALHISQTTIQGLTQFPHSLFFISTHLYELKNALPPGNTISTRFIECSLENGLPVFTYRLQEGWSHLKLGQILFEQEGLNGLLSVDRQIV